MKILIINDKWTGGGAEVQCQFEYNLLKKCGMDVRILTFDPDFQLALNGSKLNIPIYRNDVEKAIFRLIRCPEERKIRRVIESFEPDVIHVHNVYVASASLFKIIKKYPTLQTVHDYSIVCPKSTCISNNDLPCSGYEFAKCLNCCKRNVGHFTRVLIHASYRKLRDRAVDALVAPSAALCRLSKMNGFNVSKLNNPFDFSKLANDRYDNLGVKRFFAYGRIGRVKGFTPLLNEWLTFSENKDDVELVIAGKVDSDYESTFKSLLSVQRNVRYLGLLSFEEVMELYSSVYCVVVPSLWMENYPNTVTEALSNRKLVIGSKRGGIPEMIGDERFIFEPTRPGEILSVLERVYSLTEIERKEIVTRNYERAKSINSMDRYCAQLIGIFKTISSGTDDKFAN